MTGVDPLGNPARAALLGPQAQLAEGCGAVLRYPPGISPFVGLPDEPGLDDWTDLAKPIGAGKVAATAGVAATPPPGWQVLMNVDAVQLTGKLVAATPDAEAIPLGPADVPEMLDLVERTKPGPFLPHLRGDASATVTV
ncbi:MAG TPA: hypothetical protein VMA72_11810 [Streptosporangiaceae bacterium]|nr:hypothetical protein [Streptosporangiaceae bacterium]